MSFLDLLKIEFMKVKRSKIVPLIFIAPDVYKRQELPVGKIVTAFVKNGLEVSEAHTCEESLEDYFKRVTGGEGIA